MRRHDANVVRTIPLIPRCSLISPAINDNGNNDDEDEFKSLSFQSLPRLGFLNRPPVYDANALLSRPPFARNHFHPVRESMINKSSIDAARRYTLETYYSRARTRSENLSIIAHVQSC